MSMDPKPNKETLRVAQELSFARALAGNDRSLRDRALKKLSKWFATMPAKKESFNEESFTRLWKGLYYCVWMSDKPLPQEDCVERISKLIHSINNFKDARKFVRCFLQCMSQNWLQLDGFRYDKYLMLVRRLLRQLLERLSQNEWDMKTIQTVIKSDLYPILSTAPLGLNMHFSEVFFEELAKVGRGKLEPNVTFEFVKLFGELLSKSNDLRFIKSVTENVFFHLLRQSDEAIEHQMKFNAWRSTGFAGGDIDLMEEVSADEEEDDDEDEEIMENDGSDEDREDEPVLDPRAGRVDVELPPIDFDPVEIMNYLTQLKAIPDMSAKVRRQVGVILNKYETYKGGKYPLGLHKVEVLESEDEDDIIEEAAEELAEVEQNLIAESDVNGLKKRKFLSENRTVKSKIKAKKRKSTTWETSPIVNKKNAKSASPATKGSWTVSPCVENGSSDESVVEKRGFVASPIAQAVPKANLPVNSTPKIKHRQSTSSSESESPKAKKSKKKKRGSNGGILDGSWGDSAWENTNDEVEISLSPIRNNVNELTSFAESQLVTPVVNGHSHSVKTVSAKKVEFVLDRNTAQEEEEYHLSVKKRPSRPFEAALKPYQGVLKTPTNSPNVSSLDKIPPSLAEIS